MTIKIELKLDSESRKELQDLSKDFRQGWIEGLRKAMLFARSEAMKRAPVKTGHLRRSITSGVDESQALTIGWVGSDVKYAAIRELGGEIKPKNGPFLIFQAGNSWVKATRVVQPATPYLEPAVSDNIETIIDMIREEVLRRTNE
jgi:HK97 gp10 family phage protein